MSDPLTALMHAVQVMNLLKTLILKTLRDREETASADYSPMSSHSSDQQSEDDYNGQQEMNTSGELRRTKLDFDDHVEYNHNIEEELESPRSCSNYNVESVLSFTDAKTENSCLSSAYGDESVTTLTAEDRSNGDDTSSPSVESKDDTDVDMVDKFTTESVSVMPLFESS